jgi:hypothetical protein
VLENAINQYETFLSGLKSAFLEISARLDHCEVKKGKFGGNKVAFLAFLDAVR